MSIIDKYDLPASLLSHELIDDLVAGANAKAARVAPCLVSTDPPPTDGQLAEARLTLIGAVKRWIEAGTGAYTQQAAGPFSVSTDTRQRTGYNLWPSEIQGLQELCRTGSTGRQAFSIDTAPAFGARHSAACNLAFGADHCSCGADIAGFPLYGV